MLRFEQLTSAQNLKLETEWNLHRCHSFHSHHNDLVACVACRIVYEKEDILLYNPAVSRATREREREGILC